MVEYESSKGSAAFAGLPFAEGDRPVFEEAEPKSLVVITGGSGLLATALAGELGSRGADIVLLGHDSAELDQAKESLERSVRSLVLRCDLAEEADVAVAVEFLEHLDRPVDMLIHAAGLQTPSTIAWSSVKGLDQHYLWNVRGPYILTQRLLPLLSSRSGRVVFFTAPEPDEDDGGGDVHHRISLAGMHSFAKELRIEAARLGIHVLTVNAVARTWNSLSSTARSSGGGPLLDAMASAVADALMIENLDVTELSVRVPSRVSEPRRR